MTKKKSREIPWLDGTLRTEYTREYDKKEAEQGERHPKKNIVHPLVKSKAVFKGRTAMKEAYQEWPIPKTKNCKPKPSTIGKRPFNCQTTYGDEFPKKEASNNSPSQKPSPASVNAPFYGETTTTADYPEWPHAPAASMKPKESKVPGKQFNGNTLYRHEFRKWESQKNIKQRPQEEKFLNLPLGAASSYRVDYPGKQVGCNRRQPQSRGKTEIPWAPCSLLTEYDAQYMEKEGGADIEGRKDKKPLVQSKVPFKGISVTRLDYPAHTAGVPAKAKAQETKPFSKRPFDDATTYNREFVEKDVAPTNLKSNAHPQRRQFDPKFEGQSTSHTDYPGWDVKPQQPFHPPDRKIPCLQHTQNTLYREDYPEWEIIRPSPREKKGIVPGMPLTNETTYGVDFVPKKISPSGGCRGRPWEDCESCSTE